MDNKVDQRQWKYVFGIFVFVLFQSLGFLFFHFWEEGRLGNFRSTISERKKMLHFLEGACVLHHDTGSSRERRQGSILTSFVKQFLDLQEKALTTACSRRADLCVAGPQGVTGDKGRRGQSGLIGSHGLKGDKGDMGALGVRGPGGVTGLKGIKGTQGTTGASGVTGHKGIKGTSGLTGTRGDPGAKGDPGTYGTPGENGPPGYNGPSGPKGLSGTKGEKGATGRQGAVGRKGSRGVVGNRGKVLHSECVCLNQLKVLGNFSDIVYVPFGSALSLHCQFNKLGIPTTWSKDGGAVSKRGASSNGDLHFQQVLSADNGTYHCSGPNGLLGYMSKDVTVVVGRKFVYDCDFETPCSWKNATDDKLEWHYQRGYTFSLGTGPSHDHTFENVSGHYIYLESSSGVTGYDAKLVSDPVSAHHQFCLTFWYQMEGKTIGSLEVRLKAHGRTGLPIWSRHGPQGTAWYLAKVDIPPQTSSSYLVLRAVRGTSYTGDIAIDDIILLDGHCP